MDSSPIVSITSIFAPIVAAAAGYVIKRALRAQDRAQAERDKVNGERYAARERVELERHEALQADIRAMRSEVRHVVGDVSKHRELLAGVAATLEGQSGRIHGAEEEIKKIVRDGCAHRKDCA